MPQMQFPSDWRGRIIFGGLGGLTLIVIRAIQVDFFINEPMKTQISGWLTLLGFAVISIIWALVADEDNQTKVFISGLGAPSVIVAFLGGSLQFLPPPSSQPPSSSQPTAPVLSMFLPTPVFAQSNDDQPDPENRPVTIEEVDFSSVGGSITDGLRTAIVGQRPPSRRKYLYLLGTTTDETRAKNIAEKLSQDLDQIYKTDAPQVHLLKPAKSNDIFLSIGHLLPTTLEAETLRGNVMSEFLGTGDDFKKTTDLLQKGVIVDTLGLSAHGPQ